MFSCSSVDPSSDDCNRYDDINERLQSIVANNDFVNSFEDDGETLILSFDKASRIFIIKDCILSSEITDRNTFIVDFGLRGIIEFPYLIPSLFQFAYNPSGWTPLSGSLNLGTTESGTLTIKVKKKNDDGVDLVKTFSHDGTSRTYPVLGLYYDHENEVVIDWTSTSGTTTETFMIATPPQPDYIPEIDIVVADTDEMEAGMTFVSYRVENNPNKPFMVDETGEVRYVLDFTGHPDFDYLNYDVGMERLSNGNFYFGKIGSNSIFEVDVLGNTINRWRMNGYNFHHNVQEKTNGNLLVTVNKNGATHLNGANTVEDHIIEIDRNTGIIINEWDLRESLDEYRTVQSVDINAMYVDWAHANAVIEDPSDNSIIVSCRKQGLIKLSNDNQVQWILNNHFGYEENRRGEDLNQFLLTPLDNAGNRITDPEILNGMENHNDFEWNWFQHAPLILDNGNILLFDNGDRRNYNTQNLYSRAVEYDIDESNMTVKQEWSYGKERGFSTYSRIVSDVDYLPETNNVLFAPGNFVFISPGVLGGRVVEVNYDTQDVVFEMTIVGNGIVWHRVERMPIYPN